MLTNKKKFNIKLINISLKTNLTLLTMDHNTNSPNKRHIRKSPINTKYDTFKNYNNTST